jgi:hypothetical protein
MKERRQVVESTGIRGRKTKSLMKFNWTSNTFLTSNWTSNTEMQIVNHINQEVTILQELTFLLQIISLLYTSEGKTEREPKL